MQRRGDFVVESRALLHLAGPIVLSQLAQVSMGLVDAVMSGHASSFDQAVVGLGVALWVPVFICLMSVVQAVSPLVAHQFGAGDHEGVVRDTREGLWLAAWTSVLPLGLVPLAARLLGAAGIDAHLTGRTTLFLWGICIGLPAALLYRALSFYSASINHTRPVMVLSWLGVAVNGVLNWILIYGHFGFPAMGGAGCGWATGVGMWISLAALAVWTAKAPAYRDWYIWRSWHGPRWAAQKRLLRLGLPMGGAGLAEVAAFCSVAVLVGRFGDAQIAANQVALNFSSLIFMLPMGLSVAISIRVGQALGAGEPLMARRLAWRGMSLGWSIAVLAIVPIVLGRHVVAAIYSDDAVVRGIAANLLLFAAVWQVFDATQVCAIGALRGYKVTLPPMIFMAGAFWLVGIPVGTWLAYEGGPMGHPLQVYGFWVGLVIGLVLVSVALVLALRRIAGAARALARPGAIGAEVGGCRES